MEFRLELQPQPLDKKIQLRDKIFLSGSCFTEHMSAKLRNHKFRMFENPHGILFNPVSLAQSINDCIIARRYTVEELFEEQGIWSSWSFHSRFSDADRNVALSNMNNSVYGAHHFLQTSRWLMLTLGSAFVYELSDHKIVANCHKVPSSNFNKRLLSIEEVQATIEEMIYKLHIFNPELHIIFTISPVRHLRDGLIENNRSKAVLLHAVHHLVDKFDKMHYFPAYELVIDDLRDYRFFAEDMVHPNYQATEYVWQKFAESCIAPESREVMKEIHKINAARVHKPLHPGSDHHRIFLNKYLEQTHALAQRFPFLDFKDEISYFSNAS
jgi:hypothetical protein